MLAQDYVQLYTTKSSLSCRGIDLPPISILTPAFSGRTPPASSLPWYLISSRRRGSGWICHESQRKKESLQSWLKGGVGEKVLNDKENTLLARDRTGSTCRPVCTILVTPVVPIVVPTAIARLLTVAGLLAIATWLVVRPMPIRIVGIRCWRCRVVFVATWWCGMRDQVGVALVVARRAQRPVALLGVELCLGHGKVVRVGMGDLAVQQQGVAGVERSEVVEVAHFLYSRLTHLLSALAVRVLLANGNYSVPCDQNSQNTSQSGLDSDENHASHGRCCLGNGKLVDEDQNAGNGKNANHGDGDVDNVAGFALVGSIPDKKAEHQSLDYELGNALRHSVVVTSGQDDSLCQHVEDGGNEDPPVVLLVVLVEQAVLDPDVLVLVQLTGIAVHLLKLLGGGEDLVSEEGQDAGEESKCHTSQGLGSPGVASGELEYTVQNPCAVQEQDKLRNCTSHSQPVVLSETGQALGEAAEESPSLQDDLHEKNDDGDRSDDNGDNQEDGHERVGGRNAQLLNVGLDTTDGHPHLSLDAAVIGAGRIGLVDAGVDFPSRKLAESIHSTLELRGRRSILQELHAVLCQVSTGGSPEVVDRHLQLGPRDEADRERKVLRVASVDLRQRDSRHAVHGHALEPAENLDETGARGHTSGSGATSNCRTCGRGSSHQQSHTSDSGRDVRDCRDIGGLAVRDFGSDTCDILVRVDSNQFERSYGRNIGDLESDGWDLAGVIGGNLL
ncbi:hypothetical protein FJTKL_08905 [Diaporthe vaccinii]|uniref:Uncharacterized protein n=1 Tax=Diaporthe vaccinii TaxID=105482 RepID=A0ABR4EQ26_9PEZI